MDILTNIDNPRELEKMYRSNKAAFKTAFNLLYPDLKDKLIANYWNERLNYQSVPSGAGESPEISWGSKGELTFVVLASLLAGFIAKVPAFFHLDAEHFYQRNIGFVVFPLLAIYFFRRNHFNIQQTILAGLATLISLFFINLIPGDNNSDTLVLSCIHLPLFLWAMVGFSYVGENIRDHQKRIDFLKYNGDLVVMTALILIAGGILSAITIGLFSVIGFQIQKFYMDYVAVFGLAATPIVATYIVQTNPQLVNKVSPVIAKIFSPLVLIMLVIYLVAMMFSGKDPYQDRDFLIVFNVLLIGVMAIILFSVAETNKEGENRLSNFVLFALCMVTILVNGIAFSAILFRIAEWGISPNRLAILGGNVLMLSNLLLIAFRLFKRVFQKSNGTGVAHSISVFLPVYMLWMLVVTFVFPLVFYFR